MKYFVLIISIIIFSGCDSSKLTETPDAQFVGTWKIVDRGMLENIEFEIFKEQNGNFVGVVKKINDDKYVKMFLEVGDKIVTGIKRNSNFEFVISEKKIAAPLFSAYGQSTTNELKATFDGKDKIILGKDESDGAYLRVR